MELIRQSKCKKEKMFEMRLRGRSHVFVLQKVDSKIGKVSKSRVDEVRGGRRVSDYIPIRDHRSFIAYSVLAWSLGLLELAAADTAWCKYTRQEPVPLVSISILYLGRRRMTLC